MNAAQFIPQLKGSGRCIKCGGEAPGATICDACDAKLAKPAETTRRTALKTMLADGWPVRHCRKLGEEGLTSHALIKAPELGAMTDSGGMVVLFGQQGRGKTALACWVELQRRIKDQRAGMFMTAQDLLSRIKCSWADNSEDKLMRSLRQVPFLVLDEMDERAGSEWEEYTLFNLLNHRYNDERATILISNLSGKELSDSTVKGSLRPKLRARINEAGGMFECNWPSYR